MDQPIEDRRGEHLVAEDRAPLRRLTGFENPFLETMASLVDFLSISATLDRQILSATFK